MAKSKLEIEQEYQDALKVSSSMVGDLTKLIEGNTSATKKKSDAEKGYQTSLKQMLEDSDKASTIQERIAIVEAEKEKISKNYFGKNKQIGQLQIAALDVQTSQLSTLDMIDKKAGGLQESLSGALDGFHSSLGDIPVLGGLLQKVTSGPLEAMKSKIGDSAKSFVTGFGEAAKGGKAGIMGFVKSSIGGFRAMGIAMLTGPQAIIFGLLAIIALGVKAFANMEAGAKEFRKETGLLNSQMGDVETTINSVYIETAGLGASMEDVAKNAAAFVNEFGGIEKPSANVVKSLTVMNKNFGVAVGDAVSVNKAFQNMGGLSADVAQSNLESLTSLAKQEGVAPSKVMADIAESAEEANGFFRGNVQAMGAAAINAAKMGSSLKEAVKVSRGLLDYQNSIGGEMEASAILGTNLNFSQSRYLAAQGDVVGAQASMVEQLRNSVDLQNMSIFEQEALEKATGMTLGQMQNMARLQELNLGLDEDRNKVLQEAIKGGLDISKMSADEIKAKTEALSKQQEMQGALESMGNELGAMGSQLLQMFLPIGKLVMAVLKPLMGYWSAIMRPIGNSISSLMGAFSEIGDIFNEIFPPDKNGAGALSKVFDVIGSILGGAISFGINLFANGIKMVAALLSGVMDVFNGLMSGDFSMVADGLLSIGESILRFFQAIPMALFDTIIDVFPSVGTYFTGLWTGIKEKAISIGPDIWKSIKGAFTAAYNFIGSVFSKLADMVMAPWLPLIALFKGDIGLGEALMGIGTALLDNIMLIPTLLWDGFTSLFGGIGSWIKEKILSGLGSIGTYLFGDDEETANDGATATSDSINDGVVQDGKVVSTNPADFLLATKDPSGLAQELGGGGVGVDMSGVIAELQSLKSALLSNKDVYIDNEKITSRISKTQEKSNINQFGLMGA